MQRLAEITYDRLRQELQIFTEQKIKTLADRTTDLAGFLGALEVLWVDHCEQLSTVRNLFLYLDR